nr:MAG TPA_asm: hypothetical protein [Bacteriophage sp.]
MLLLNSNLLLLQLTLLYQIKKLLAKSLYSYLSGGLFSLINQHQIVTLL